MSGLPGAIDAFSSLSLLVVGDILLDVYLEGSADAVCREAPVPRVRLDRREDVPGGAANAALNACALGADVCLLGAVGADDEGRRVRAALAEAGVDCGDIVEDDARETLTIHRVLASSQLLLRFDAGTTRAISGAAEADLVERLRARWHDADVVLVSDYTYGTFTPAVVVALESLQRHAPKVLVVDSKHVAAFRRLRPTAVKPNWSEARQLLVEPLPHDALHRADVVGERGEEILEMTGARIAAVTLDSEGAIVFEHGCPPHRTYANRSASIFTTGAGDTFVTALALALGAGAGTPEAAELASAASAIVVGKDGTATCTAEELRRNVVGHDKVLSGPAELAAVVRSHRAHGRRVVFTNGCFDLLHRGHTSYLSRAKLLGDVLIVGVNDDDSVSALKGPRRPINPLDDRLRVLAALSSVDHLVAFGGASPTELIEAARPEVFAKGGDYSRETLPEAELVDALGGEVTFIPIEPDRSTTRIIELVQAQGTASCMSLRLRREGDLRGEHDVAAVDVLVPTYERPAALAVTLTSLVGQVEPPFRVVVSDQSASCDPFEVGEVRAAVNVLRATGHEVECLTHLPRRGMAEHRQFLLDQVRAPYALFLDDDVIVEPDLVARLLAAIRRERCGFVGSFVNAPGSIRSPTPIDQVPPGLAMELWEGPVHPEVVLPGTPVWERRHLHFAAYPWRLASQLGITRATERLYKVAWVGGCVLFDAAVLRATGGFDFWEALPPEHVGEDVVAQLRVMAAAGGAGLVPSGAWHQEVRTTLPHDQRRVDAPHVLLAEREPHPAATIGDHR